MIWVFFVSKIKVVNLFSFTVPHFHIGKRNTRSLYVFCFDGKQRWIEGNHCFSPLFFACVSYRVDINWKNLRNKNNFIDDFSRETVSYKERLQTVTLLHSENNRNWTLTNMIKCPTKSLRAYFSPTQIITNNTLINQQCLAFFILIFTKNTHTQLEEKKNYKS